jgi:hypothetical protein
LDSIWGNLIYSLHLLICLSFIDFTLISSFMRLQIAVQRKRKCKMSAAASASIAQTVETFSANSCGLTPALSVAQHPSYWALSCR